MAIYTYTCEPSDQLEKRWSFSNDDLGACDGGGQWVEIPTSTFGGEVVDQEEVETLVAAIVFVLILAFGFRIALNMLFNRR